MKISKGFGCKIHASVEFDPAAEITLGDHVEIHENVKIGPGQFIVGDYSKIHRHTWINPGQGVSLGHLAWIGQNSILDGTGGIKAGNFLGVGAYSALYSHIRHGDVLEGCRYNKTKRLIIGDDVWFVGSCLVSPITAEDKSMAMLGSVITRDMKYNHVYGGNPGIDITEKTGEPYQMMLSFEKIPQLQSLLNEYRKHAPLTTVELVTEYPDVLKSGITYYNTRNRTYTKLNTPEEIQFNKWLFSYRAKFIPR